MKKLISVFLAALFFLSPVMVSHSVFINSSSFLLGDANGDNAVNAEDALFIKTAVANRKNEYIMAADLYADGKISAKDSLYLKAVFADRISISDIDSGAAVYKFEIGGTDVSSFSVTSDISAARLFSDGINAALGITLPCDKTSKNLIEFDIDPAMYGYEYSVKDGTLHISGTENTVSDAVRDILENKLGCICDGENTVPCEKIRYASIDEGECVISASPETVTGTFSEDVKDSLDLIIEKYKKGSPDSKGRSYAVFDIDSIALCDMTDMYISYQTEHMAFPHTQKSMIAIMSNVQINIDKETFPAEYERFTTLKSEVTSLYKNLRTKYGANINGITEEKLAEAKSDESYLKFVADMKEMAHISETSGLMNMCFCEMTGEEIYKVTTDCLSNGKEADIIPDPVAELWKTFMSNGIDIWVTSECEADVVRAVIDNAGLHDACCGIIAKTAKQSGGKVTVFPDCEFGYPFRSKDNGLWLREFTVTPASCGDFVTSVDAVCGEYYDASPVAVFTGNEKSLALCSSFEKMPLAVCLNTRKAGVLAEIAVYQKEYLGYDLKSANMAGDTFFALQGIDENKREFSDSSLSVGNGEDAETLFFDGSSSEKVEKYKNSDMKTSDIADSFLGKTGAYHEKKYSYSKTEPISVSAEPSDITVMSLNIRCGNDEGGHSIEERRPRIKETVTRENPDVIGFQECTPEWLDHLYDDYGTKYGIYNVWRDTEELESAPILWKKDKFDLLEKGGFWLSDTPSVMSDGYDPVKRMVQYVRLREKGAGKEFIYMNTHVGFIEANQAKSCTVILDYAKKISSLPTFITGDFNFQPSTKGYNVMTTYFTDVNAVTAKDTGETFHGYYHGYEPVELVDYCFTDERITPISSRVLRETFDGKYISDHYALVFKLEY